MGIFFIPSLLRRASLGNTLSSRREGSIDDLPVRSRRFLLPRPGESFVGAIPTAALNV